MSLQSFPKAGLFLSRQKILCRYKVCRGGVATESFLSRPTDQACARNRALGAHTIGLGIHMSARTSGGAARATEPTAIDMSMIGLTTGVIDLSSSQQCTVLCTV